jgi:uncharacterized membrane protein
MSIATGTVQPSQRLLYSVAAGAIIVSYVLGWVVYIAVPRPMNAVGVLQFFNIAAPVTAAFLVTDGVVFAQLYPAIPKHFRTRWISFFALGFTALFVALLTSTIWLLSFAAIAPVVPDIVTEAGLTIVFGSWVLGFLVLILELAYMIPRD